MPKTAQPSIEDRIAARVAEREASKPDLDTQAREDAEMSLPALNDLIAIGQRIKTDFAALSAAADRVFMPAADAGLATIRNPETTKNLGLIIDLVMVSATAVKAQAEVVLATPKPEA